VAFLQVFSQVFLFRLLPGQKHGQGFQAGSPLCAAQNAGNIRRGKACAIKGWINAGQATDGW
jgi:hypothetical protein